MGERFGERIRRVRKEKGLGLRETAARVEISATYLSRLETNEEKSPPAEKVIRHLARVLGDEFDILMQLAGRIPTEVADYVTSEPGMPEFLRTARDKNFSADDLMKLIARKKGTR
jgi:transcriptional regulator with XRE-family HTH domain